jgi:hypothetical protein
VVRLPDELDEASVIAWVRVGGYADGKAWWTPLNPSGAVNHARCEGELTPRASAAAELAKASSLTAHWPPPGAEVLVVVSREGVVSLFGRREGEEVRLWSPQETGSIALFHCHAPARPLPGEDTQSVPQGSWDGCRVPVSVLLLKPGTSSTDAGPPAPR